MLGFFCEKIFVVVVFKAVPMEYGNSQARGQIGATAAELHTATAMWDPSHICDLCCSVWQSRMSILNPLSEARD